MSIRVPASPSSAGRSVTAATMATATVMAEASPMVAMDGMPAMRRPAMAMTTVVPAKRTALPEVALARPADSSTERPSCRNPRWRVTMNSA